MDASKNALGPLPRGDRQETLQQLSLTALRSMVPQRLFQFRDERNDDKGVDGVLEVKEPHDDGGYGFTNYRAQFQIKSTDSAASLAGGDYSVAVATSNLNYLLNGPSPLYFLWIEPRQEMRFAWARDEHARIGASRTDWQSQASVSIHFRDVATPAAFKDIYDRILREGRATRKVFETVTRSSNDERVVIQIDATSLESSDPHTLYQWLNESGMSIVSSGFGQRVIDWFLLLNAARRKEPRIQLVAGYAHAALGRNQEALGYLSMAALGRSSLCETDREVLDCLDVACRFFVGQIGYDEFRAKESAWAKTQSGPASIERRMDLLRRERLQARDPRVRRDLLATMRSVFAELERCPGVARSRLLQAQIALLSATGDDLCVRFINAITLLNLKASIRAPSRDDVVREQRAVGEAWAAWCREMQSVVDQAREDGHPVLLADALSTLVAVSIVQGQIVKKDAESDGRTWALPDAVGSQLRSYCAEAHDIFATAGHLEGTARTKLQLAELHLLRGQNEETGALIADVQTVADAMKYTGLASRTRDILEGTGTNLSYPSFRANEDFFVAERTDRELTEIAGLMMQAANHPPNALPVFERECRVDRQMAIERTTFCQHIQMSDSPMRPIDFLVLPPRRCRCDLHGHASNIEHDDPSVVLSSFKANYCPGCPDRMPKTRQPAGDLRTGCERAET